MNITEQLFLSVSNTLKVRVTPDNLRSMMRDVSAVGGITGHVKTEILRELLIAFAQLEAKVDELAKTKNPPII